MPGLPRHAAFTSAYPIAAAIAAAALLFCWPAIYNGFPLVYGDTASYLDTVDPRKTLWARQIFYTALLRLMHWHISLWPAIFIQALLTAHILYLVVRAMLPRLQLELYVFIAAILALTTSLPWHTSALLPDCFTPILVLGVFLLAFCRGSLHRFEIAYLVALVALAAVIHLSHIPLAIGLIVVVFALRLAFRMRDGKGARTSLLLVAPVLAAASAHLGINTAVHSSFSLSPASSIWLLARFIADGPAQAYLRDECPTRPFVLCAYLAELPNDSDEFLWGQRTSDSVFNRAGGYPVLRDEARAIVKGTLARYPGWVLGAFVKNAARQFVDVGTGHWLHFGANMLEQPISEYIRVQFPRAYAQYENSAQLKEAIPIAALAAWHVGFVVIGALTCALLLVRARSQPRPFILLLFMVLAALIGNAMVTGGISAVHDRYQTRVVWLIVFVACVGTLAYIRNPVPAGHHADSRSSQPT
ncbi:MAG TPA: hypothetical protein VHM01_20745 [Alphaproteobacteria bacterium]|nr:hypothetical protein [Alphaproteobacteria bacterium]